MFEKVDVQPRTLVDAVADRIREAITSGDLEVGQQLPSERALGEQLGVSRTVLREALSSLEALGIVESRSTRGRFVAAKGSDAQSQSLVSAWLHQHASEISELDEIRSVIESYAVRTMTPEDTALAVRTARRLMIDQRAALARGDAVECTAIDSDFHWLLVSHLSNGTFRSLAKELIERSRQVGLAVYSIPSAGERSIEQHDAIVEALERGNLDDAAAQLVQHTLNSGGALATAGAEGAEKVVGQD